MSSVSFHQADISKVIKRKKLLKEFIPFIFSNEQKELESIGIIFCSDDYLLSVNQQFLQHDYYTDIITFDLSESEKIVSELYISVDRVKENAELQQTNFENELHRVIFHGALHLCGYGDKTKSEKVKMMEKENEYLEKFASFHVKLQNK